MILQRAHHTILQLRSNIKGERLSGICCIEVFGTSLLTFINEINLEFFNLLKLVIPSLKVKEACAGLIRHVPA